MGKNRIAVDRPWRDYPIGTKAHSCIGGHWTRTERGWQASSGCTFPTPGGDAVGACIELPTLHSDMVTCPACQCDLDGIRCEYDPELEAIWPEWLSMGFCSPECFSKSA